MARGGRRCCAGATAGGSTWDGSLPRTHTLDGAGERGMGIVLLSLPSSLLPSGGLALRSPTAVAMPDHSHLVIPLALCPLDRPSPPSAPHPTLCPHCLCQSIAPQPSGDPLLEVEVQPSTAGSGTPTAAAAAAAATVAPRVVSDVPASQCCLQNERDDTGGWKRGGRSRGWDEGSAKCDLPRRVAGGLGRGHMGGSRSWELWRVGQHGWARWTGGEQRGEWRAGACVCGVRHRGGS